MDKIYTYIYHIYTSVFDCGLFKCSHFIEYLY